MPKPKNANLSVFKGREAKLNRAIIQALAAEEPRSTWGLCKKIRQIKGMKHISYSTVNKRVRNLEQSGYLRKVAVKERTGGITNFYELRPKAYLATFLNSISMENLLGLFNDDNALTILADIVGVMEFETKS